MTNLFPVVILAGGLATRLQPLTNTLPKSMISIAKVPFIAYQLRLLKQSGVERVVICAGYLGDSVQEFVGNGARFGLQVDYSYDGKILLGSGGAIKKALTLLDDHFFVLYGDSYLPCDYRAVQNAFMQQSKSALMTVYRNQDQWDKSNVEFNDGRIVTYDKHQKTPRMQYIDYGLGVFHRHAFEHVPYHQFYDLAHVYQYALDHDTLAAFETSERFYEVGSFQGIEDFSKYVGLSSLLVE